MTEAEKVGELKLGRDSVEIRYRWVFFLWFLRHFRQFWTAFLTFLALFRPFLVLFGPFFGVFRVFFGSGGGFSAEKVPKLLVFRLFKKKICCMLLYKKF
jgi:hypothetical protein